MTCPDDDPCAPAEDRSNKHTAKVFLFISDPQGSIDNGYDRIAIDLSKAGPSGPWKRVLKVDDGIEILEDVYNYMYSDDAAESTWWFRPVLADSTGVETEVPQKPRQAVDTSFEAILSIEELRNLYLFGVDLTDDANRPYPAELFAHYIRSAIDHISMMVDISLLPERTVERKDWYRRDWYSFCFLKLLKKPVIQVESVKLKYPTDDSVLTFNANAIRLDKHAGHIQLFPAMGSFVTQSGSFLPLLLSGADFLPGIWEIIYFAGFDLGKLPGNIKDLVGYIASTGPLNIAGDLVAGAGIQSRSLSFDGLSESLATTNSSTNAGYGARLLEYRKTIKPLEETIKKYFNGAKLSVIA